MSVRPAQTGEQVKQSRSGFADEYPFESHFLEIDGRRYHYVDEGQGDVLLMVHGNPTWSFAWRNLVKDLSRDYRVIAVDHMGCGLSDKPQQYEYTLKQHIRNLATLIETLDLQQISLFAHDWGGAIGMGAAVQLPDRFARFVLCNTAAFRSQRIPLRIAVCRIPILGALAIRGFNAFSRAALTMAVADRSKMTATVRAGYLSPYDSWKNRVAVLRFVQDIPLVESHPSFATLKHVEDGLAQFQDTPMLLVWGTQDWCFTTVFLDEFESRFPKAEALRLENAGHYLFEDAADQLIARSRAFLDRHPLDQSTREQPSLESDA